SPVSRSDIDLDHHQLRIIVQIQLLHMFILDGYLVIFMQIPGQRSQVIRTSAIAHRCRIIGFQRASSRTYVGMKPRVRWLADEMRAAMGRRRPMNSENTAESPRTY